MCEWQNNVENTHETRKIRSQEKYIKKGMKIDFNKLSK